MMAGNVHIKGQVELSFLYLLHIWIVLLQYKLKSLVCHIFSKWIFWLKPHLFHIYMYIN